MNKGGFVQQPQMARFFRYAGLFVPFVLILYGFALYANIISSERTVNLTLLIAISIAWVIVGILQFLIRKQSKTTVIIILTAYHVIAGIYLVFITEVMSPLSIYWLLLALASYAYFSKRGLIASILAYFVVAVVDGVVDGMLLVQHSVLDHNLTMFATVSIIALIIYYISKFQNAITEELATSKAQESLQRSRVVSIVNNLTDAVISTDKDGIIRVYNAACLNLLDTNNNLNGRHIDEILPLFDMENNEVSLYQQLKSTRTVIKRDDLNYVISEDEKMRLEITFTPIRSSFKSSKASEAHDGYIVIMRDITKEKSLEEERDEFISVISHELRTPITIVEGTLSNIQVMMGHPDVTDKMLRDSIDTAHDQTLFLAGMVNDLSTLSRAERGVGDSAEDIDVHELATELHKKYQTDAKAKKLHLNLDASAKLGKVHVSRLYLEELLQNFITNSIKYTKQGSVTIQIKQKNDIISFTVKDTGIGISKSDQQKVFAKFYRSEDYRTRETSGTGLGLYVSSKLAHKMGTKIHLVSRLNFGSSFSFNLPVVK